MDFNELRMGIELLKRLYEHTMEPVCTRHNVTHMELNLLLFLANNPGMDTASELVGQHRLPKSHVSMSVRALTSRGLLARSYRDGNRKTAHLSPRPEARPIITDGFAAQETFFSTLCDGVSPDELAALGSVTGRVLKNLQAALH